jgi:Heavy metal associated domain 2
VSGPENEVLVEQQEESEVAGAPPAGGAAMAAANGASTNGVAPPKPKKHKARIEHKIPGRIRMKVPAAKSNPEILEVYREAFSMVPGIIKVKAKPETGSIVIHYDPEQEKKFEHHFHKCCGQHLGEVSEGPRPDDEVNQIARRIEAEAEFLAERSEFAKTTVEFFKNCDRELKRATDNTIDLKIVLAGGLAAFTFLEIGAEAATPMWVTLALFSLNQFAELQHQDPRPPAAQTV